MLPLLAPTGRASFALLAYLGRMGALAGQMSYWTVCGPLLRKKPIGRAHLGERLVETGPNSIPVVALIMVLTGMVLAMQLSAQLRRFGVETLTPGAVAVTICREIGPLLTAILVAARVGAAITAEIGTMVVSDEVLALRTMAINPVRYLVVPRMLAMIVMMPCLTVIADYVGMGGGMLIGMAYLHMSPETYIRESANALELADVLAGLAKSVAFGFQVSLVACYEGLAVKRGAAGVGEATTRSVVVSIIFIIVIDLVFTQLFFTA